MAATWLRERRGDLIWNTLVLMTVMLPLASLTVDVPLYFLAAQQLEQGLAAAAQDAVNTCLDLEAYSHTGAPTLDAACLTRAAERRFTLTAASLQADGHRSRLTDVGCDAICREVTVRGTVTPRNFIVTTPTLTLVREAKSRVRMTQG